MHIIFFDQPGADDISLCGGKAASLGRLASTNKVPPGFCLTVNAYQKWLATGSNEMPDEIASKIRDAYAGLEEVCGEPNVPVAVRSSAVDEDGSGESFAGLHDTYLNIIGAESVTGAVIECWRSLRIQRALDYRTARGLKTSTPMMGVAVQQLVLADVSAVAFSANPISGDWTEVVINANYGLGEAVVSGATTPDTIVVKKDDPSQQEVTIGSKEIMTVRTDSGTTEKSVPSTMRGQPALTSEQAREIAALAQRLEEQHGWPIDLECAIHGSQLYLLQCRPITTL